MSRDTERSALAEMVSAQGRALADALSRFSSAAPEAPFTGTPRQLVWRDGPRRLFRYQADPSSKGARDAVARPLLLVYAMVNRPRILDLTRERSLISALLARGQTVYLLDWGTPTSDDWARDFGDHAITALGQAVDAVLQHAGTGELCLLGVCQGGVMSLCQAMANPAPIAGLITTVTPVDFHTPDDRLSKMARHVDPALVAGCGNVVPGSLLNQMFLALKPMALGHRKYVDLAMNVKGLRAWQDFLAMEDWIADSPDQPAATMAEFLLKFYQGNQLVAGELELAGRRIDSAGLSMPVLNIYAEGDHIVPPAASCALADLVPAKNYAEMSVPGGHIGLYVGRAALECVPDAIDRFCRGLP